MGERRDPSRRIRSGCTWTQDEETASGCGDRRTVPGPGSAAIWTLHLLPGPGHTVEENRQVVSMVRSKDQDLNQPYVRIRHVIEAMALFVRRMGALVGHVVERTLPNPGRVLKETGTVKIRT